MLLDITVVGVAAVTSWSCTCISINEKAHISLYSALSILSQPRSMANTRAHVTQNFLLGLRDLNNSNIANWCLTISSNVSKNLICHQRCLFVCVCARTCFRSGVLVCLFTGMFMCLQFKKSCSESETFYVNPLARLAVQIPLKNFSLIFQSSKENVVTWWKCRLGWINFLVLSSEWKRTVELIDPVKFMATLIVLNYPIMCVDKYFFS